VGCLIFALTDFSVRYSIDLRAFIILVSRSTALSSEASPGKLGENTKLVN